MEEALQPIVILTRKFGAGLGTAGYAFNLYTHLKSMGEVRYEVGSLPHLNTLCQQYRRRGFLVIALDRINHAHLLRAGGGCHQAFALTTKGHQRQVGEDQAAITSANLVVCNSQQVRAELVALYGVARKKIHVIRTGVDLVRFHPLSPTKREEHRLRNKINGRLFTFVGHGFRRKGLAVAVAAFKHIKQRNDQLWILGSDGLRRRWRCRFSNPQIFFKGSMDPGVILPIADLNVLPTTYDAAANVTLESLACGTPTITSRWDGSSEIVPDDRWVLRNPQSIPQAVAAMMQALVAPKRTLCRQAASSWPASCNAEAIHALLTERR